jgi:hypothetical protein
MQWGAQKSMLLLLKEFGPVFKSRRACCLVAWHGSSKELQCLMRALRMALKRVNETERLSRRGHHEARKTGESPPALRWLIFNCLKSYVALGFDC